MSWVRYDDGFDSNPKVTAVIAEDPAALALHVLANTWSARQKRPGFVPTHQPAILVASKPKARKWTALLEEAGLWDVVEGGWEFHDHADYRMPPSSRQTAGTPEELSSKRREAGRKGGATTQRRKQTPEQNHEPPEQNQTWSSKSLSPVVASNEATPEPVPEIHSAPTVLPAVAGIALTSTQRSQRITDAYSDLVHGMCKWPAVNAIVLKAIKAKLWTDDEIGRALARLASEERPVTVDTLRVELNGLPTRTGRRQAETDAMFDQQMARAQARDREAASR